MAWAHEGRAIAASVVLDGRAAAFWFFLLHGRGVLESVYTGYDTAYEKLSPGTLLVYFFLEQVFFGDSRFSILDWTEGDAEYKRIFSNDSVRCAQLMYLRPTPGPLSLLAVDAAILGVRSVTRPLVASLKRSGYAATIRRWRRGH